MFIQLVQAKHLGRMRTPLNPTAAARAARPTRSATWVTAALAIVVCLSGCSVCQQARRTMLYEPLHFGWKLDRARSLKTYRRWAADAWRFEKSACPEVAASSHYAEGFRDGFVDLLYAGGDGQPPPIPPRKFWNMAWRGPAGQAGAQQWFAGFRRGAQVAHEGGYRQQATVESSFRAAAHEGWEEQVLGPPATAPEEVAPPDEPLPTPAPTLPAEPAGDATPANPTLPPAEAAPVEADGAAQQFRRALDAAGAVPPAPAPVDDSDPSLRPLALPVLDAVDPAAPAESFPANSESL
jgi:hypothetical protein